MDRTEFMSLVYDELQSDGDNNRANRIIDAADEYAESTMPRWIPVTERLPEKGHNILISTSYGYVGEGEYKGLKEYRHTWVQYRWSVLLRDDEVTAWMPLPEPYREEEKHD